jgi:hypothetical protein
MDRSLIMGETRVLDRLMALPENRAAGELTMATALADASAPNRGPGRPRYESAEDEGAAESPLPVMPALSPIERRAFDYSALEDSMAQLNAVVRRARHALNPLTLTGDKQGLASAGSSSQGDGACQ